MDGAGLMIREYDKVSDHSFKICAVRISTDVCRRDAARLNGYLYIDKEFRAYDTAKYT